ncbi:hypothetical protein POM88_011910 [Heracleum sosnowskyi]|uniref:Uncharacterized protein n=1 Tax=Heracleum sosnowskyi TaxID=360622 RepID=A0AAD8N186_9APIA|nr:hypothetical protein POM88_011910 [Heracleum sosnowskyi]
MYDEMQLVVGKDIATGLYAKSFIDVDSASTEMDSHPVDDIAEKETSESSAPSKQKRSHRKRKERSSDANVDDDGNGIKELAIEVREIAKAMKDMSKQQLNVSELYEEVMKMEGFSEIILELHLWREEGYEASGIEVLIDNEDTDVWLAHLGKPKDGKSDKENLPHVEMLKIKKNAIQSISFEGLGAYFSDTTRGKRTARKFKLLGVVN